MTRQSWLMNCLLAATTIVLLINVQSSDGAKRYSYYWWDVSLLRSEGVSQANYSGIQQELIDLGAVDVRLLDNARVLFLENCQKRMSTRPWNCSRIRPKPYQAPSDSSLPPPYFGKFIDQSHREAAFIHALSTAVLLQEMVRSQVKCGIHYSVGLSAERSQIPEKKCTAEDFECCTDLVRVFIRDSELQSRQMSSETYWNWVAVNEHNRAVGIEAFKVWGLKVIEDCYGISGACTNFQTFIFVKEAPVSKSLLELYDKALATKVAVDSYTGARTIVYKTWTRQSQKTSIHESHKPKFTEMIYLRKSPSFCSGKYGLATPSGRRCEEEGNTDGITCAGLCCGKGIVKRKYERTIPHTCRFVFCCQIFCMGETKFVGTQTYCR